MTLGEAIRAAHVEMLRAEQRRNELLAGARERGASLDDLGHLLGVDASTAYRWSGVKLRTRNDPAKSAVVLASSADCATTIPWTTEEIGPATLATSGATAPRSRP